MQIQTLQKLKYISNTNTVAFVPSLLVTTAAHNNAYIEQSTQTGDMMPYADCVWKYESISFCGQQQPSTTKQDDRYADVVYRAEPTSGNDPFLAEKAQHWWVNSCHSCKQIMRMKPVWFEFKLFILATSNGFPLRVLIYQENWASRVKEDMVQPALVLQWSWSFYTPFECQQSLGHLRQLLHLSYLAATLEGEEHPWYRDCAQQPPSRSRISIEQRNRQVQTINPLGPVHGRHGCSKV